VTDLQSAEEFYKAINLSWSDDQAIALIRARDKAVANECRKIAFEAKMLANAETQFKMAEFVQENCEIPIDNYAERLGAEQPKEDVR